MDIQGDLQPGMMVRWSDDSSTRWFEGELLSTATTDITWTIRVVASNISSWVGGIGTLSRDGTGHLGPVDVTPIDPLDVEYDGVKLDILLKRDYFNRNELAQTVGAAPIMITPNQRAAISAHWSAQLRAKAVPK